MTYCTSSTKLGNGPKAECRVCVHVCLCVRVCVCVTYLRTRVRFLLALELGGLVMRWYTVQEGRRGEGEGRGGEGWRGGDRREGREGVSEEGRVVWCDVRELYAVQCGTWYMSLLRAAYREGSQ